MSHEIWGNRFAAVRVPAWHGIGTLYQDPVLPSEAAVDVDLLYGVDKFPLVIDAGEGRMLDTGLVLVGRVDGDQLHSYGTATNFDVVMLADVLPNLDTLASQYPLSAAGALRNGAEAFFTFTVNQGSEIAGEEYQEFLTVVHSYTPGVAHRFIYSPVRVVCNNTLVMSDSVATSKISVSHVKKSKERLDAGYIVSEAIARSSIIKTNLEKLTKVAVTDEEAKQVLETVYERYQPAKRIDPMVGDLVTDEIMSTLFSKRESQQRYFENLCRMGLDSFATLNNEYPVTAGTAYNLYQAVVEVADWRRGKSAAGNMESAVVGVRANEKRVAWDILVSRL